ncbi:F-box protein [Salix suchowensis]|nr:F-box protein [Salix suchowensis]
MNMEINHYHGMKKGEPEGNDAIVGSDDSLPVDPFGMDIKFSRLTALFQDFDGGFGPSFAKLGVNGEEKTMVDDGSFVGVDLFFNGAWRLHSQEGNLSISDEVSTPDHSFSRYGADCGVSAGGFSSETNVHNWADCEKGRELGGEPHDALFFALGYLGVKDLLVAERLCRSLRDAVRGDPMLWRRIHIDQPLSVKITDEALVKLTSRAQGTLHCLSLVGCIRITDTGLMQVLESNSRLTKLCVPGCVGLTIDSILCNLRILKSAGTLRIKHIRIGGLFGVTENRFEEFKSLLGMDHMHPRAKTPQFHRVGQLYPSCDDDRAIDIEMCPKCKQLKLVYDCPAESCQGKDQADQICRACTLCIARCIQCGCCIKDCDYEETFCLDFLCLDCLKHLFNCQEKPEVRGASSSGHTVSHHEMKYHFCLYSE